MDAAAPGLDLPLALAPLVAEVARIAVLRSGGIGDYVVAEPAIAALRVAYPEAELTLLGAEHHRQLVVGRAGPVDRFVPVPLVRGVRYGVAPDASESSVEAWCIEQRGHGYDLAVQLHGGGRWSNPLVARLGARVTAGPAAPDAVRLGRWVPYSPLQHDTIRWLEVAALCGASWSRLEPVLAVVSGDLDEAEAALGPLSAGPLLAVHPGASEPRRRWPPDRLGAVAASLVAEGAQVVVLGGPSDRALAEEVAAAAGPGAVDLSGRLGLGGLLGVLSRAALFLGVDSGPRHLAAAVGTPTVAVFTNANLADVAPLTRVWHRIAVSWGSACARCGLALVDGDCGHGETALGDVGVEEVRALACELWAQVVAAERVRQS